MWAIVTNGSVNVIRQQAQSINGVQYPKNIFNLWSKEELKAIGVYRVEEVGSHSNSQTHNNRTSGLVYNSDTDVVVQTKSSTIKDDAVQITKDNMMSRVKVQVAGTLSGSDWYIIREAEGGTAAGTPIKNFRAAVRAKGNALELLILAATTFEELTAMTDNTEVDGEQVLGVANDWPELEDFES
jgi:hypothetical protein